MVLVHTDDFREGFFEEVLDINTSTAFSMRHKLMCYLESKTETTRLGSDVQLDEKFVKTEHLNRYASMFSVSWNLRDMRSDRDRLYKTVFSYAREYSEVIRNTELAGRNVYMPEDKLWRAF